MKYLKLLSSMFVLTAVIKSAEVDMCGFSGFRFEGIKVHFAVKDSNYNLVTRDAEVCGQNMTEVQNTIKDMLNGAQTRINELTMERTQKEKFNSQAQRLVGTEVRGD